MRCNRSQRTFNRLAGQQDAHDNPKPKAAAFVCDVPLDDEDRIEPPQIDRALAWYAITLRPGSFRRVIEALKRAKIAYYCPVETGWRRRARSRVSEQYQRPLFGSLLFVGTDERTDWYAIRFNDDISGVLSNYGLPLPIPVGDLESVARRERLGDFSTERGEGQASDPVDEPEENAPDGVVRVGDIALLNEGFFEGEPVDVVGMHAEEARVILRHFRSASIMRVPTSMLQPAPREMADA